MHTRPIPSTGEALPVIGCGTYIGFDQTAGSPNYRALPHVLEALFKAGGTLLDSSPMYGRAETTAGELLLDRPADQAVFLATKVRTTGLAAGLRQMEASMAKLRTERVDLMQIHNLVDWRTHLPTLQRWKAEGRIRYIGLTHYTASAYDEVEAALRAAQFDFLQINYSIDDARAAERLLPLSADLGVSVLVNRPFGGGALVRRLRGRALPSWAGELECTTWSQVLPKFVLSHPAVTCAIPGSGSALHMAENAAAGAGPIPAVGDWADKLAALRG